MKQERVTRESRISIRGDKMRDSVSDGKRGRVKATMTRKRKKDKERREGKVLGLSFCSLIPDL